MLIADLQRLLDKKESAKQAHAILRTSDSWRQYVLARDTYYNALALAAPSLFAIAQALSVVTPAKPCWECGEYDACVPDCTHGQARAALAVLAALRLPRAH
jgi:hypothetical protein